MSLRGDTNDFMKGHPLHHKILLAFVSPRLPYGGSYLSIQRFISPPLMHDVIHLGRLISPVTPFARKILHLLGVR